MITAGCELWADGARVADGDVVTDPRAPIALAGLTVSWGRGTTVDQPDPATLTVDILDRQAGPVRVQDMIHLGSVLVVFGPVAAASGPARAVVFAGRVTDLDLGYDGALGGAVLSVIAADKMADLANRFVGAEPWPAETLAARAGRIAAAVALPAVSVAARPGALPVSRMDVDRQDAARLFQQLGSTGYAAVWVEVDSAGVARIVIEDPTLRPGAWVLGQGGDGLWRPVAGPALGRILDAGSVDRDDIVWRRSTSDLVTRVTVRWLDQSTTPDPTERSIGVSNDDQESEFGPRGLSVGTILADQAAATTLGNLLLAAHQETSAWRAGDLTWDTAAADDTADNRSLLADLLDNRTRYGLALALAPLPSWVPAGADAGMYVDGGTYVFSGGRWVLSLLATSAIGFGDSMTYADTPRGIRYADYARDVSYVDLIGVGPPVSFELDRPIPRPQSARPDTRGGVNAYGLPIPYPTDPYADTALALRNLAVALEPLLVKVPIYFLPSPGNYTSDGYADIIIDLSAYFTTTSIWMVNHNHNVANGTPVILQSVTHPAEPAGKIRVRVLQVLPPDGTRLTNKNIWMSFAVWGTPK